MLTDIIIPAFPHFVKRIFSKILFFCNFVVNSENCTNFRYIFCTHRASICRFLKKAARRFPNHFTNSAICVIINKSTKGGVEMSIQESGEMYLETIYVLSQNGGSVRSIDVSEHMGYSKPSVSRAIGILKKDGYINVDRSGFISLTDAGKEHAEKIFERHTIITEFLKNLGVDAKTAAEDACKMEHIISDASFEAIKRFDRSDK